MPRSSGVGGAWQSAPAVCKLDIRIGGGLLASRSASYFRAFGLLCWRVARCRDLGGLV